MDSCQRYSMLNSLGGDIRKGSSRPGKRTLYWRTGDLEYGMLEVGIASDTGAIRKINTVSIDKLSLDSIKILLPEPAESGTPVFDTANWPENGLKDDPGKFEVHCSDGEAALIVSDHPMSKQIISGSVCFGLDRDSNVCAIVIKNLTQNEFDGIKDTLLFLKGNPVS